MVKITTNFESLKKTTLNPRLVYHNAGIIELLLFSIIKN